mmetsp:Transcript_28785/g.32921  ORF Transcript_28785/g.32921 Transcript_28785/m.32921 type:complete len:204 (+) Transcript_28785:328-939(+)
MRKLRTIFKMEGMGQQTPRPLQPLSVKIKFMKLLAKMLQMPVMTFLFTRKLRNFQFASLRRNKMMISMQRPCQGRIPKFSSIMCMTRDWAKKRSPDIIAVEPLTTDRSSISVSVHLLIFKEFLCLDLEFLMFLCSQQQIPTDREPRRAKNRYITEICHTPSLMRIMSAVTPSIVLRASFSDRGLIRSIQTAVIAMEDIRNHKQ